MLSSVRKYPCCGARSSFGSKVVAIEARWGAVMRLRCRRRRSQKQSSPIDVSMATGVATPIATLAPVDSPDELGAGVDDDNGVVVEPIAEDVEVDVEGRFVACQLI